jgi:uncharacterized protein (DUF305 family)
MNVSVIFPTPFFRHASISVFLLALAAAGQAQQVPIIQPGAPGETPQEISAEQALEIADTGFSKADAQFMQDMIPHHNQAVQMSALVADRTNRPEIVDVAGRIDVSQADEIEFMQRWLRERGEDVPDPTAHEAMHTSHQMAGMASPEQMTQLAESSGTDFDRLFLQLMIPHHEGAVTMVDELLKQPGAAYDPLMFEFTTDITNDQTAEIERMNKLLVSLSDDPRAGLKAGYKDAGEAILNLELVAVLPKTPGFFDPANPAVLPLPIPQDDTEEDTADDDAADEAASDEEYDDNWSQRPPRLAFDNTDIAFSGDVMITGSYHGYNIYKLADDGLPEHLSSVVCSGGQGDVSIIGDILIMSVEQSTGRVDCGSTGVSDDVSPERFMGLRVFDISDLTRPRQVGQVQTCRGSHTHSVVNDGKDDGKIIVYNSGTSGVRDEEELAGCVNELPGDERTALFRIDVIEIPIDDPSKARIVGSPAVFADQETGSLAGLWRGGDHGDDTQDTSPTDQCHDITTFPELGIAGGACSGNGILFDISDPRNPTRIDEVVDDGFAYWHSATFNNDGTKVIFTDEWGGSSMPRCRAYDPLNWGADAIYDIVDGKLEFRSHFKMPAPQVETENCVAHNGSIIPVPGRDIFVQAWYQGGVSVIDFTDSANPVEIAYFDRGPISEEHLATGGYWSTYWYKGRIYGTEILRGIDVFALKPSEYLSENEIAAALIADEGNVFNPQQQTRVTWPLLPVVAKAHVDQLERTGSMSDEQVAELRAALNRADEHIQGGGRDRKLARELKSLAKGLDNGGDDVAARQRASLVQTLNSIAASLS